MPRRATTGPLTPMPTVLLDLGRYVTVRPRKDGTARVLFEVPARLRPSGWSPAIPLPITGERRGDLTDAGEVACIQSDAKGLLERLRAARMGREPGLPPRSIPALIRSWESGQDFKKKRPRTQLGYSYHAGLIAAWSKANGHKPVDTIGFQAISDFLAYFDDRPTTRRHVKIVFKMLLDQAVKLEWRAGNPLIGLTMGAPESKVTIWERPDVDRLAKACEVAGQPSIAVLIMTQWEIGQRLTDVRLFRRGAEYLGGMFRFKQSKTGAYVSVQVSKALQALIERHINLDSPYLFTDAQTGKPFAEQRLGHVFAAIRGDQPLVLRALRHSCVVQLARSGCTVPQIASVTGHSPFSAEQILSRYLPRDNELARQAQQKRGLIGTKRR